MHTTAPATDDRATRVADVPDLLWIFLSGMTLVLGCWYIVWRWDATLLNTSPWFSIPVILAETFAVAGVVIANLRQRLLMGITSGAGTAGGSHADDPDTGLRFDISPRWARHDRPAPVPAIGEPGALRQWMVVWYNDTCRACDSFIHDDPLFHGGIGLRQKLLYITAIWPHLTGPMSGILLATPIVFFFTGMLPVTACSPEYLLHAGAFLLVSEITVLASPATRGGVVRLPGATGFLPVHWVAFAHAIHGRQARRGRVPARLARGSMTLLVLPQLMLIIVTLAGIAHAVWRSMSGIGYDYPGLIVFILWGAFITMHLGRVVWIALTREQPPIAS